MRLTFAELTEHNPRLQRAVARLEELDRLKSNFLATMSHELRTPLTSVIGYAEMMAEGLAGPISREQTRVPDDDPRQGRPAARPHHRGARRVVARVAASSRSSARRCRSRDLVASEVATFAPQAGRRGIAIQLEARGDTVVVGDRRKIRQVVSSLLSNAVKFTPDRGRGRRRGAAAARSRRTGRRRRRASAVQLVVSDSGIGISRDQVAQDLRAVLPGRFVVDPRVRRHRPRPHAREGVRRGARRADLGRHHARVRARRSPRRSRRASGGPARRDRRARRSRCPLAVARASWSRRSARAPRSRCSRSAGSIASSSRTRTRLADRRIVAHARAAAPADRDGADRQRGVQQHARGARVRGGRQRCVDASPWLRSAAIALAIALPLVVLVAEVTSKTLAAKAPLAWARAVRVAAVRVRARRDAGPARDRSSRRELLLRAARRGGARAARARSVRGGVPHARRRRLARRARSTRASAG